MERKKNNDVELATYGEDRLVSRPKVVVDVEVELADNAKQTDKVYIVGNVSELGNWNVVKAKPLRAKDGKFTYRLSVNPDTTVEFKVCKDKSWDGVEKGMWGEEIFNHSVVACSDQNYHLRVHNWNC